MPASELIDAAAELQEGFDCDFAHKMTEQFELDTIKKYRQLSFGIKTLLTAIITLANNSKISKSHE